LPPDLHLLLCLWSAPDEPEFDRRHQSRWGEESAEASASNREGQPPSASAHRASVPRCSWVNTTSVTRESILLPDVRDESLLAQTLRGAMGELMETTFHYVRSTPRRMMLERGGQSNWAKNFTLEEGAFEWYN